MSGAPLKIETRCCAGFTRTELRRIRTNAAARCSAAMATTSREVLDLLPLANRRDDSPRNRFEVTPDDVRLAEKTAREKQFELIGWYHSHPGCSGAPERIRSRARLAVVQLHYCERSEGRAARHHVVASARRPRRLRSRSNRNRGAFQRNRRALLNSTAARYE